MDGYLRQPVQPADLAAALSAVVVS